MSESKPLEHTVEAILSIRGLSDRQQVKLDGHDISRYVQRIQVDTPPGELMRCVIFLMLIGDKGRPSLEYPEQLANVVVVEDFEAVRTRYLLEQAVEWLKQMWGTGITSGQQGFLLECGQAAAAGPTPMETLEAYITRTRQQELRDAD